MTTLGNLYSKNIMIRLTNSKSSEDKFKLIHITVDYQITGTLQSHKTELIIKLTDENDPFFLYSLYMTEEDFQTLKHQQGLLVDFSSFGQRFIDLLYACEKDVHSDNPKFQLQLFTKEPLPFDHTNANLNIIEINPFKHLVHLSLSFMPGNDSDVKKYLATCLKSLKEEYNKLAKCFDDTKSQLNQKLESTQQQLNQKSIELDKLKVENESQSERLMAKHLQELSFERDKAIQNQYSLQQKYEKEKKDLEMNLMKTIKQLEQRLFDLETTNKDLYEKKFKSEAQIQEITIKHSTLFDEYNSLKLELSTLRKENSNLDSEMHSSEKLINQLKSRNSSLEQELKEKKDLFAKSQEMLSEEQEQRRKFEESLREKNSEVKKKQSEINHYVDEFKKGNEVVNKLQEREKTLVSQIKLKTRILTEQEKVVKEKEKEIGDLKSQMKEINSKFDEMNKENKELRDTVGKKTSELEEAAKLLKRDENIISWLNKQLTENNIGGTMHSSKTNTYDSGQFRPYGTINPGNSTNNLISCSVSSMTTGLNQDQNSSKAGKTTIGERFYSVSQNQIGLNSRAASNGSQMNNNEMDSLPMGIRQIDLNKSSSITAKLDPKYFQSHSPQAPASPADTYNENLNFKMSNFKPASYGLGKNVVQSNESDAYSPKNSNHKYNTLSSDQASNGLKSNPSLASAYFPTN